MYNAIIWKIYEANKTLIRMFYYFTNILLYDFSAVINFALNKKRGEQMNESPQYQIE